MEKKVLKLNRFEVGTQVKSTIAETLAVPLASVTDTTLVIEDLKANSMDIIAIALAIDDVFGIEIELDKIPQENVTVLWIVDYVLSRKNV
jgi:acyl carrier protein